MRDIRRIISGKKALRDSRAYAERNGIEIVGTYIDRAYSARTDNRPDFQRMIKDSAKGKFDVVIVWKEELSHPKLERDEILFWLKRFRELDTAKLSHRRRLIDSFVNSIILYDDRIIFTSNYKDSTKTITFAEIEAAGLSSDLTASLGL